MSTKRDDRMIGAKLEDVRTRLMEDPSKEDLEAMQLQLDVLEKWDRLMLPAMMMRHEEHHDHMDDHVHHSS